MKLTTIRFFLFILAQLPLSHLSGQIYLNLDFETNKYPTLNPKQWKIEASGYDVSLDSLDVFSGLFSLKIENHNIQNDTDAEFTSSLPIGFVSSSQTTIRAKIKTLNIDGIVGIFVGIENSEGKVIAQKEAIAGKNKEHPEWVDISLDIDVPIDAKKFYFGGRFKGTGTARFDLFEIIIDGVPYEEKIPPIIFPKKEELAWLKRNIIPIRTTNPDETNDEDLKPFKDILDGIKIVALGEVTHGSKEIFNLKHRIIKYLSVNLGFDIFSIEASMPEAYELNKYVIENKGYPKNLIGQMGFWTWNTEEMLSLVNWMNRHNQKNEKKIHFTGFDMQSHKGAVQTLKSESKGKVLEVIKKIEHSLDSVKSNTKNGLNLASYYSKDLNFLKDSFSSMSMGKPEKDWLLQNITILEQMTNNYHYTMRDYYMATNVNWILNQNRQSKLILWAHNGHIKKSGITMGKYLSEVHQKEYLSVGFAFSEGYYSAIGDSGVKSYKAETSYPGTYEFFFNAIKEPFFLLDLRNLDTNNENNKWLINKMRLRQTGALKVENEFYETSVTDDFDIIIFINQSHASRLLNRSK